jgi:propanol-preferring alcohol dehydrogenase
MVLHRQDEIENSPLKLEEVDQPQPAPGQVRIKIAACGLCRTDLHTAEGDLQLHKQPVIPGHQIAGTVDAIGDETTRFSIGDRVGIAWLHETCGLCRFCEQDRENLCLDGNFTGWDVDGGYAEYCVIGEEWAYLLPDGIDFVDSTPLLCGGIVGYRALKMAQPGPGRRIGMYGFGNSAHVNIQVAIHLGCEVYVFTRADHHKRHAEELGAVWVGEVPEVPPHPLDASIMFAPAGVLVPDALKVLDRGGTLVLGSIYMTPVPEMDYPTYLWDERTIRSVANATRNDGNDLLRYAAEIPVTTNTVTFPLEEVNEALLKMKRSELTGDAVLVP